jgi:hypothetical protein
MARICLVVAMLSLGLAACDNGGGTSTEPDAAGQPRRERTVPPPVVGCANRIEPIVKRFSQRDLVRGPFAVFGFARESGRAALLSQQSFQTRAGRLAQLKMPLALRAGHTATLHVSATQSTHAALLYRQGARDANRIQDGDQAVSFKPCSPATPAFAGRGKVGAITSWAGQIIVTGPRCIRLELRVDGQRQPDIRLPLGHRCP